MNLHGIIPPAVTPMTADHELDLPGLRRHIDHLLAHRVHAVFVLGTTGEFYALDEGEKQAVVAAAVDHCRGRSPVWAGTGAETTREVIRLTKMAEREGADGVSVITPYFLKPTQAELVDHFRRVAESTSLPVVLYSNPGPCGGLAIEPDTAARLAGLPNVVGIKDSSGDLQNTIELLRVTPEDTEDIAAEVLLKLVADDFRALRDFRGNSSLATYLVVIARRTCVKELARRQGVKDAIRRGESRVPEAEPDDAPAAVKGIERLEEVDKLLKKLGGREREIVRLYYLEGRTYEEISTETDVPVNTIGAVLSRARKKLREAARTSAEVPVLPARPKKPPKAK